MTTVRYRPVTLLLTLATLACAAAPPSDASQIGARPESCDDACEAEATRCSGAQVQRCESVDGCLFWAAPAACADGEECRNGSCAPSCSECAPGSRQGVEADAHAYRACVARGDGCRVWDETVKRCPGAQVFDGSDCADCVSSDLCPDTELCAGGGCLPILGADYDLRVLAGDLSEAADSWLDTPDPYVVVLVDGVEAARTKTVSSSLKPVWNETLKLKLPVNAAALGVRVYDADTFSDTLLGELVCGDVCLAQTFRSGRYAGGLGDGSKATVVFEVTRTGP